MIIENLIQIRNNIQGAMAKQAQTQKSEEFKLIAVTKNHDVAAMREAIDAGITAIGENRVQEAVKKAALLNRTAEWHLIGHLQTNKVKAAVDLFDCIHSVESEKLLLEIDRAAGEAGKIQDILIQLNIAKEASKFGIYREDLEGFIQQVLQLGHVRLCGLMAIAPHYDNAEASRPLFRDMFALFTDLKDRNLKAADIKWLSMGMSSDYEIAIEEGSNIVRIGTSIFGERQY